MTDTGLATGILLTALGAFLILRTVVHDDNNRNLVDVILGLDKAAPAGAGGSGQSSTGAGAAATPTSAPTPVVDPATLRVPHPSTVHLRHPVSRM